MNTKHEVSGSIPKPNNIIIIEILILSKFSVITVMSVIFVIVLVLGSIPGPDNV